MLIGLGLPREAPAWSLASFNIGVEIGQLIIVLVVIALAHLAMHRSADPETFPQRFVPPASIAVIAAEIVTALLLLVPRTVRLGALCSAALLIGFASYALYYVYGLHGEPLECGCFGGIIASQLGVKTALRNLALLLPAIIVWFGYRNMGRRSRKELLIGQY